ncbi:unnamed protein product [Leuciscus chuanchicus]
MLRASAMSTLTEIGFGSAGAVIRQQEGIMGVEMSLLTSLTQVSILAIFLFQCVTSVPVLGRYLGEEDSISSTDIFSPRKVLFPRDDADMFVLQGGRSGLQTRQLGDIEFTNRYAELLKSKAKITSICAFLKRMQSSKKRPPLASPGRVARPEPDSDLSATAGAPSGAKSVLKRTFGSLWRRDNAPLGQGTWTREPWWSDRTSWASPREGGSSPVKVRSVHLLALLLEQPRTHGVVEEGDTLIGLGNGKQAPPGCLGPRGAHPLLRAVKSGCPVDWSFGRAWGWSSLLLPDLRVDLGRLRWPV